MRYVIKRLFREEFNSLLFMNLIVAALCIPVVTIGPALLALTGTLVKIVDDRCQLDRVKEFWSLFKSKFWQGILFEVLLAGYAFILLWSQSLAVQLGDSGDFILILVLILSILAAMVSVCVAVILASVRMPFGEALWNGFLMALGRFPWAFLSALCVYGMLYLALLLYPVSLLPAAVIMISVTAVLSLAAIWKPLDELVLSACED